MPVHMKTGIVLSDRFRIDNVTIKKLRLQKNGYGRIRRHTLTMFQGHGWSVSKGPTEWRTPHTRIYGRARGI